jgi:GTP-binding protein
MSKNTNPNIRNIAIIAHVDHGKTTLVDFMLREGATLKTSESGQDRVMDSMDLERERGITIAAKNCSVWWKDVKINILDTPGHADFGGEVERALKMVDGVILLVDSSEGPLPQTRFVLKKALEASLPIILLINKIDRQDARPEEVLNDVYDLFIDLDANESQIEFPVLYAIGRDGIAKKTLDEPGVNLAPLFDTILETLPAPKFNDEEPLQILVTNIGYSDYLGRLSIGRVVNGSVKKGENLIRVGEGGVEYPIKLSAIQVYQGLVFAQVDEALPGEIVILAGADDIQIGDTICRKDSPKALPRISVDEPTISVSITANTSPFAGREGQFVQSRRIWDRLQKEALHNVAIKVEDDPDNDAFVVKGRGEFQMAILIETMRREGYELTVGRPKILYKKEGDELLEPIEHLYVDCDESYLGSVTEKLAIRKGKMTNLVNHGSGRVRIEFSVPSRGLIGYRNEFLTDTRGTGLMNSYLSGYEPYRGDFASRKTGSLVADRDGDAVAYGLYHLEPRGRLFVSPGEKLYRGMIIGEHNRENDLYVNSSKEKKLSNMRASGKDENIQLTPVLPLTLEAAMEFIKDDELLEVTPKNIRLRKASLK